jgi:glycosyltransferase 2 family protein
MAGKRLPNLLKMLFGLGVLTWIGWHLEFAKLWRLARQGEPLDFALGAGFLVLAMIGLQWSRLHLLIKSFTPSLAISLRIFFVGALFNNFLPSNIGGDAVRLLYLKNLRADGWGTPFMLLLIYRLSSFLLLVLSGLLYLALERERLLELLQVEHLIVRLAPSTWFAIALASLLLLAAGFALRKRLSQRLGARFAEFARACKLAVSLLSRADLISLGVQTALFQLCRMLSFYFLVRYMGQQVALWDLTFVVSASALLAVAPVTVAGLGVMEASITGLLAMYGVDLSCAGAVALMNRAVLLLSAAIGGVLYLRSAEPAAAVPSGKSTVTSV